MYEQPAFLNVMSAFPRAVALAAESSKEKEDDIGTHLVNSMTAYLQQVVDAIADPSVTNQKADLKLKFPNFWPETAIPSEKIHHCLLERAVRGVRCSDRNARINFDDKTIVFYAKNKTRWAF